MTPKNLFLLFFLLPWVCLVNSAKAHTKSYTDQSDTVHFDAKKLYAFGLDADGKSILKYLVSYDGRLLSKKDSAIKANFEDRFKYSSDQTSFLQEKNSPLNNLLKIYVDYWRASLLSTQPNDQQLKQNLVRLLIDETPAAAALTSASLEMDIDAQLKKYVNSKGYQTTGFARTGKLVDLLIWKTQRDTTYIFTLPGEKINAPVRFLDQFLTLGWEEYATFGRYYPGGWASKDFMYCVRKAYDLNSENFLVSYLAHEGRHFSDNKNFPDLSGAELEYRAKLTELILAEKTLQQTIAFFINNANAESQNPHSKGNYQVISELSKIIFKIPFEKDLDKWKSQPHYLIKDTCSALFDADTKRIRKD